MGYIDKNGNYYEGDQQGVDKEIPQRPTQYHIWQDGEWHYAPSESDYVSVVQSHLNAQAKIRGYDDIKSAALRAGYPGPFHNEGVAYASWMDACWARCYQVLSAVQAGSRSIPTVAELIAELPVLVLP